MTGSPELDIDAIRSQLGALQTDFDLNYLPWVDSTNRYLATLPPHAWKNGSAVLTDFQSSGRGRGSRAWLAPHGTSILFSVMFLLEEPWSATLFPMMMGVAVSDAISKVTGLESALKWPNDVLVNGKKVSGILSESSRQGRVDRVVLGAGINVNFEPELDPSMEGATSLKSALGSPVSREKLAVALFKALDLWYRCLARNPEEIRSVWIRRLDTIGKSITVYERSGSWVGTAKGAQKDGSLLVTDLEGQTRVIYAADVSVRTQGE